MAHRQINVSRGTLFFTLLIVSVILQLAPHGYTQRLNLYFVQTFKPVLNIRPPKFSRIFRPAPASEEFVSRAEYNELLTAYNNTHGALMELHKRYEALGGIRSGLPKTGAGLVLASVISPSTSVFAQEIIISEGSASGIKAGQLVVCQNSIIGSVSEAREKTATVQLVTDLKHTIIVNVWRPGGTGIADIMREGRQKPIVEGPMIGDGKDACKIPMVSRQVDVRVGDTVFASAERGLLDTPIVIGEVSAITNDQNQPLLWDITVRPILGREDLARVAVIVMNPRETP